MFSIKKIAGAIACTCAVTLMAIGFTGFSASAVTYGGATLTAATRLTSSSSDVELDSAYGTTEHNKWFIFTPTTSSTYLITVTTPDEYAYCSLYSYDYASTYRVVNTGYDTEPSDYTDMQSPDVANSSAASGLANSISSAEYIYQISNGAAAMSFHVTLNAGTTYALFLAGGDNSSISGTVAFSDSGGSGGGLATPVSTFVCTGSDSGAGTASFSWTAPAYTSCSEGTSSTALIIQQSTDGSTWTSSATSAIGATDTTATVTGLSAGTTYQFRLLVPIGDNAGWSNTASVNISAGALTAPTPNAFNSATASWSAVTDTSGYTVTLYRPDSTTVSYTTTDTSYTFTSGSSDSDFIANGSYYFKVVANGNGGTTSDSAAGTSGSYAYTAAAPSITTVTAAAGNYYAGDTVSITVNFNQAVEVSGSVSKSLLLSVGGTAKAADYSSGSDTSTVIFQYVVETDDEGAITVSGFSSSVTLIATVSGTAADQTLPTGNLSGVYAALPNQQPTLTTTSDSPDLLTSSSTPVSLFSGTNATVGAGESGTGQKFQSLKFFVYGMQNTADEYLVIDGSKVSFPTSTAGTASGITTTGAFTYAITYVLIPGATDSSEYQYYYTVTITKTGNFSAAECNTLIDGLQYGVTPYALSGDRYLELIDLIDDGETDHSGNNELAMSPTDHQSMVTVTYVDIAPTVTATGVNPTYYAGDAAKALFNVTVLDPVESGQSITGVALNVSSVVDSGEALVIDGTTVALTNGISGTTTGGNSITYSVSVLSGTATVTLTKTDTAENWIKYLNAITYQDTASAVTTGDRTVTLTSVTDSGSTDNSGKITTLPDVVSTVEVAVSVTGVSLDSAAKALTVGGTATLTATITPANATDQNVTWSSSDTGVATVDSTGKVTAVSTGTATITATTEDGGKTASCTVTVSAATVSVTGVSLDLAAKALTVGDTATLTATITPATRQTKM